MKYSSYLLLLLALLVTNSARSQEAFDFRYPDSSNLYRFNILDGLHSNTTVYASELLFRFSESVSNTSDVIDSIYADVSGLQSVSLSIYSDTIRHLPSRIVYSHTNSGQPVVDEVQFVYDANDQLIQEIFLRDNATIKTMWFHRDPSGRLDSINYYNSLSNPDPSDDLVKRFFYNQSTLDSTYSTNLDGTNEYSSKYYFSSQLTLDSIRSNSISFPMPNRFYSRLGLESGSVVRDSTYYSWVQPESNIVSTHLFNSQGVLDSSFTVIKTDSNFWDASDIQESYKLEFDGNLRVSQIQALKRINNSTLLSLDIEIYYSSKIGIQERDQQHLIAWPNPINAGGLLMLNYEVANPVLIGLDGRTHSLNVNGFEINIPENLPTGVYTLRAHIQNSRFESLSIRIIIN